MHMEQAMHTTETLPTKAERRTDALRCLQSARSQLLRAASKLDGAAPRAHVECLLAIAATDDVIEAVRRASDETARFRHDDLLQKGE